MTARVPVPCNGCVACCRNELVVLYPEHGDDLTLEHDKVDTPHGPLHVLKQRENGDCFYLGPQGCTIHDRAPAICKVFDCRRYFLSMPRAERRQLAQRNGAKIGIFEAGHARLTSLTDEERREAINQRSMTRAVAISDRQWLRKTAGL